MRALLFLLVALVAFVLGGWFTGGFDSARQAAPELAQTGYVLDQPRALPEFQMVDQSGQVFSQEDFKGDWSFIYFGYTYCPDICPMSLAELARVKQALGPAAEQLPDEYYLVSVDPRRDSPERIKEYVAYFDPQFRGLTGDSTAIDAFTRAAGVVYQVPDAPADSDYLVGHSSTITLINPDGAIHAFFTTPLEAQPIAEDFVRITSGWENTRLAN